MEVLSLLSHLNGLIDGILNYGRLKDMRLLLLTLMAVQDKDRNIQMRLETIGEDSLMKI
jgi:hypothetical protein